MNATAPSARCAMSIPGPAKVRFHGSFALFDANASPSRDEDEEIMVSSKVPMPIVACHICVCLVNFYHIQSSIKLTKLLQSHLPCNTASSGGFPEAG